MSGETRVRVGGSWVEPDDILHYDGSWQSVQEGFVRSRGAWVRVWPPRAPQAVQTYNATSSGLWHDFSSGWTGFGNQPEQGAHAVGNHRGLWFYGSPPWAGDLAADGGRRVTKVEIYLTRISGHMGWGSTGSIGPRLWYHRWNSQPSGRPAIYGGPYQGPGIARNESRWVTLPSSWHRVFEDGTLRGIAVHTPDGGPISAYQGPSQSVSGGRLRITHE